MFTHHAALNEALDTIPSWFCSNVSTFKSAVFEPGTSKFPIASYEPLVTMMTVMMISHLS